MRSQGFAIIRAVVDQAALLAERVLRAAYSAPVADQIDVDLKAAPGGYKFAHYPMSFFVRASGGNQVQSPGDPHDMSVDREAWTVTGEQQRAGDCFWTDSVKAAQKVFCLGKRSGPEKRQVQRAEPRVDLIQKLFDPD